MKMVMQGYVYSGWGKDPGSKKHNWRKWHQHCGIYREATSQIISTTLKNALRKYVKDVSDRWKARGYFISRADKKFCSICVEVDAEKSKAVVSEADRPENCNPVFAPFMVKQAMEMKNGTRTLGDFEAPCDMFCAEHALATVNESIQQNQFRKEELKAILEACVKAGFTPGQVE